MKWSQSGFAERLKTTLAQRGQSQKDFAIASAINEGTLSGWKERNEPKYEDMVRLAEALDVRPGWLYFNDTFEAADDEEKELLELWRKMTEAERFGFLNTFKAIAAARPETKKPGKRTKSSTAAPHPLQPVAPLAGAGKVATLPTLSMEEYREMMGFLLKTLDGGRRELPAMVGLERVLPLLRQLNPALSSAPSAGGAVKASGPDAKDESNDESGVLPGKARRKLALSSTSKAPPRAK